MRQSETGVSGNGVYVAQSDVQPTGPSTGSYRSPQTDLTGSPSTADLGAFQSLTSSDMKRHVKTDAIYRDLGVALDATRVVLLEVMELLDDASRTQVPTVQFAACDHAVLRLRRVGANRSLADPVRMLLLATENSLVNADSTLNSAQLNQLILSVSEARDNPSMSSEAAIELIGILEHIGCNITLPHIGWLEDLLDA